MDIISCLKSKSASVLAVLWCGSLVFFSGCKAVENLATIRVNYSSEFDIPASVPATIPFTTPEVDNDNTGQAGLVNRATLDKATLTIESPAGQNFRFLKSVRYYLQAEGLPEVEVANKFNIDNNVGNSVELNVTGAELKEYLKKPKFKLRSESTTDEPTTQTTKIKVGLSFKVLVAG